MMMLDDNDDNTAQLHILSWQPGQMSQKQQTATLIYQAIAISVPATHKPLQCHKYVVCADYYT